MVIVLQCAEQTFLSSLRRRIAEQGYRSVQDFTDDVTSLLTDNVPEASDSFRDKVICYCFF